MTDAAALSDAVPTFLALVNELDGWVPSPVLCVDSSGIVHAAALPAGSVARGELLTGYSLEALLSPQSGDLLGLLVDLQDAGHARAALELPSSNAPIEAYLVLVERGQGAPAVPRGELLPRILDAAPPPMLGLSDERVIVVANAACRALLAKAEADLIGVDVGEIFAEAEDAEQFAQALGGAGSQQPFRAHVRTGDGDARPVELVPQPVYGGQTRPRGWVLWLRDPGRSPAADRSEPLARCIREVAHDVRSPLCSIRGFAGLLERDFGALLGEVGRSYLERVRSNLDRLQGMIEGLLDVARPQPATGLSPCWILPEDLFAALRMELKPTLEARGIALCLPEEPPPLWADPVRCQQVVLNLVTNAIQHMGEVEDARIELGVEAGDSGRVLVVRDNGCGLSNDEHNRILELFENGGARRGLQGLGLAIVQRIMEAHGGRIEAESTRGGGSEFRCFFPDPV